MKVEIWSDFVCPFCYIGKRNFETALSKTGLKDKVEVVYKAYELAPDSPTTTDKSMTAGLAEKYKISEDEAKVMLDNIAAQAKSVGLIYDFDNMLAANTFVAHRVAKLAESKNLGEEMTETLLHAYFTDAKQIGSEEVLMELAQKVGIDKKEVKDVLNSDKYIEEVKADVTEAGQVGVKGVPFFVINNKYAISGAQPPEAFAEALNKVAKEEGIEPGLEILGDETGVCKDDNCEI